MRELPQQYLDNMTGEEWFNYNVDNGTIPSNISDQVRNIIDTEVNARAEEIRDSYEDGLVSSYDEGYEQGRREALQK